MGNVARSRRVFVVATLMLSTFCGVVAAGAVPAGACDLNNHCYGKVLSSGPSDIDGVEVYIQPNCLSTPNTNFVTDEIWLVQSGSPQYWVEDGYLQEGSGLDIGGITSAGRYLFWADSRPAIYGSSGGFHAHVLHSGPNLDSKDVRIGWTDTGAYNIVVGSYTAQSTKNYMDPDYGQWGSETTSSSAHSYGYNVATRYKRYLQTPTWYDGIYQPQTPIQESPQVFTWTDKPNGYYAGVPC